MSKTKDKNQQSGDNSKLSLAEWNNVVATNATGVFLSMKYEIPVMLRQGGGIIVNTGMTTEVAAKEYPINRLATAEEMARVVMWLSSDDASIMVGTDIDATGGYLTK